MSKVAETLLRMAAEQEDIAQFLGLLHSAINRAQDGDANAALDLRDAFRVLEVGQSRGDRSTGSVVVDLATWRESKGCGAS